MSGTIANFPGAGYIGNFNVAAQIHGQYYLGSQQGTSFFATTGTAGRIVPVQASNLVATFALANPATSTRTVELLIYSCGLVNATTVVGDISLYYQVGGAALATVTTLVVQPAMLGSSATSTSVVYSNATFTGALTRGPTLLSFGAVTTSVAGPIDVRLDGRVLIPPGTTVALAGNAAQTAAMQHTFFWNEV